MINITTNNKCLNTNLIKKVSVTLRMNYQGV